MSFARSRYSPASARGSLAGKPPFAKPPRILLAEDDAKLRLLVATTLREAGYEVIEVQDGGRLLVQIAGAYAGHGRHAVCDMVVSDIRMPICSGMEILEGLRKAHWTTPVILMTAFRNEATRTLAASLSATLLEKPFGLDELLQAVLNLLPGRGSG
jgi:DNA-binding response OmpR family regulator